MAEVKANFASFFGMFFIMIFSALGGWGCLPLTVPGAKAALPLPLLMRGILAVPLPVPRDSAVVFFPAMGSLPCGCILLDCMAKTARFITSGLRGVELSLIHISEPTRLGMISYAVFC